jgi:hypothetical protein
MVRLFISFAGIGPCRLMAADVGEATGAMSPTTAASAFGIFFWFEVTGFLFVLFFLFLCFVLHITYLVCVASVAPNSNRARLASALSLFLGTLTAAFYCRYPSQLWQDLLTIK